MVSCRHVCCGQYLTGFMGSSLGEDDAHDQNGDEENEDDDEGEN